MEDKILVVTFVTLGTLATGGWFLVPILMFSVYTTFKKRLLRARTRWTPAQPSEQSPDHTK